MLDQHISGRVEDHLIASVSLDSDHVIDRELYLSSRRVLDKNLLQATLVTESNDVTRVRLPASILFGYELGRLLPGGIPPPEEYCGKLLLPFRNETQTMSPMRGKNVEPLSGPAVNGPMIG